ncbi:MAG: ABC transporter permease [Bacteroidetes bacterium]|nr:MAG: ABC transporter permease [Bacteroidota bacterium]
MSDYHFEITPKKNPFQLNLKELWQYRDLVILFVRRDFVAQYKQTILGPIWFFLQPIFTTLVFTLVFGKFGGLSPEGVPTFLYYLAGIILWNYFSDCLMKTSSTFIDNQGLFGKVYFPRLSVPLSIVISNLIKFGVQFLLFLCIWIYFYLRDEVTFNRTIALFPILVIIMALLGMGSGIIISSLTTKYRDLRFLLQFGIQLLMYVTPGIILSYDSIVTKFPQFKWLADINPIYPVIETFKHGWVDSGSFSWIGIGISAGITVITLLIGMVIFNRTEQNFMDTI